MFWIFCIGSLSFRARTGKTDDVPNVLNGISCHSIRDSIFYESQEMSLLYDSEQRSQTQKAIIIMYRARWSSFVVHHISPTASVTGFTATSPSLLFFEL